jgi:O-antigen ligase
LHNQWQEEKLSEYNDNNNIKSLHHPLPLHPHNGTLQTWLELGILGIALYLTIIGYTAYQIVQSNLQITEKSLFSSLFSQLIIIQQTGFGIWQNWLWAAIILAFLLLTLATRKTISD